MNGERRSLKKVRSVSPSFGMDKPFDRQRLEDIEAFVCALLSEEEFETLKLCRPNHTYLLPEQLRIILANDRCFDYCTKEEMMRDVVTAVQKYRFLLASHLNHDLIRYIFVNAIANAVGMRLGSYFVGMQSYNYEFIPSVLKYQCGSRHYGCFLGQDPNTASYMKIMHNISESIRDKYPRIPGIIQNFGHRFTYSGRRSFRDEKPQYPYQVHITMERQLTISFSREMHQLSEQKKLDMKKFNGEFLKKYRWCLERMSRCSSVLLDKYKNRLCYGMMMELGGGVELILTYIGLVYPTPLSPTNPDFNKKVVDCVIGCLTEEELKLFSEIDEEGKEGSFREQLLDRFYSQYPSFVGMEKLKKHIERGIEKYRPLFSHENLEVIKDILVDEIERGVFVSHSTHLGNLEMVENLKEDNFDCHNNRVIQAIELLLEWIPDRTKEGWVLEIDGRSFSVREQLLARGRRAWLGSNTRNFRKHLSILTVKNYQNPNTGIEKEFVSPVDFQSLLEEIDMFFLYPNKWRMKKGNGFRLDNGKKARGKWWLMKGVYLE